MSWLRFVLRLFGFGRSRGTAASTGITKASAPKRAQSTTSERARPTTPERARPTTQERVRPSTFVVIGLDFGTSGTKVVVRLLDKGRPASAVDFGTDQAGFSRFSFPSAIALENYRFLVGADAEKHENGPVFRSLKRRLLGTNEEIRHATMRQPPPRPKDLHAHPHFLVAVYLAAVLRQVCELVANEHGANVEFLYNLDIPVSQLDGGPIQRGFQTALDAAVDFAETDDLPLGDYRALWERWLDVLSRESTGSPDQQLKRWELVPESSAIVKGAEAALASIVRNSRRYTAIVDIGAGTTDLGWFKWIASEEEDRVFFFSAKTSLDGCDDVDDRLLDILAVSDTDRPLIFPAVREAKPRLGAGRQVNVWDGYRSLCSDDLRQAVDEVAERCFDEYGVSFGDAYRKERNTDRWKDIRVILVGGGSQLDGLRRQFKRHPRWQFGRDVDFHLPGSCESVGLTAKTLGAIGVSLAPPIDADIVFLLPALGLSYPAVEIPNPTLPDDIAPLPAGTRGPTGLYDYEAPDD